MSRARFAENPPISPIGFAAHLSLFPVSRASGRADKSLENCSRTCIFAQSKQINYELRRVVLELNHVPADIGLDDILEFLEAFPTKFSLLWRDTKPIP